MRGDVAGAAGIGVVAPRAADFRGLFENRKARHAGLEQTDGHAETSESGADDEGVQIGLHASIAFRNSTASAMLRPPSGIT